VKAGQVTALPSRIPELLGLTALRGSLIPVFNLATLLGMPPGVSRPSWLVLVACDTIIGLACDGFEGRQTPEWLGEDRAAQPHVLQLVRTGTGVRAVLDIPGLAQAIRTRAGLTEPAMEKKQ
jgi:purine-binding chemotaxis protein CheW